MPADVAFIETLLKIGVGSAVPVPIAVDVVGHALAKAVE